MTNTSRTQALEALDKFVVAFKYHAKIRPSVDWKRTNFGHWENLIRKDLQQPDWQEVIKRIEAGKIEEKCMMDAVENNALNQAIKIIEEVNNEG